MRHATFRQLEVFEAIARQGSFTRAAEALHLTQPTVSMQIRKLTHTVGLPLVEQVGKRIFLTEAGRELATASREIFERLARFEMLIADMKGLKQGHLKLAAVTTAQYYAPRLLGAFCKLYPGVDVALVVTNREQLLAQFAANEDDLYIIGQPPPELEVEYHPFVENPLVVLARSDHPLAGREGISLERLAREPMIVREQGSGTRKALERLLESQRLELNIRMELGSNEAIKQAIAGGLGVSVLSRHTLALDPSAGGLAILDVEHFPLKGYWNVAWPKGKQLSIIARTFVEYLQETAKRMAPPFATEVSSAGR